MTKLNMHRSLDLVSLNLPLLPRTSDANSRLKLLTYQLYYCYATYKLIGKISYSRLNKGALDKQELLQSISNIFHND